MPPSEFHSFLDILAKTDEALKAGFCRCSGDSVSIYELVDLVVTVFFQEILSSFGTKREAKELALLSHCC